jgi:hypothetical protein
MRIFVKIFIFDSYFLKFHELGQILTDFYDFRCILKVNNRIIINRLGSVTNRLANRKLTG